jgi:hypothetical protein
VEKAPLPPAFVTCLQDPRVVVSALMKLAGGSPSLAKELNVDAFLQQVPDSKHSTAQHQLMVSDGNPVHFVISPSSPLCPVRGN